MLRQTIVRLVPGRGTGRLLLGIVAAATLASSAWSQTYTEVTPGASGVTASTNDGNLPSNAVDSNLATRWSANGDGQWLQLDLGTDQTVGYVRVAAYLGNTRQTRFDIQVSSGGGVWTTAFSGLTSGTSTALQTFDFPDVSARYVRYLGHGNTANTWNSVTEIEVFAAAGTPTATPTPTPTTPTATPTSRPTATPTGGFRHPGVLNTREGLDFVKAKINAGAQPWKAAYDQMRATSLASLSRNPSPFSIVECGPYSNPNNGCTEERDDAAAAYAHALIWYVSGNTANAQKAIQYMNAWSAKLTDHTNSNAPLQTGWAGSNWTKAAEIIRHTGAGWSSSDVSRFRTWLINVYYNEVKGGSGANGNWEMIITDAIMGIGVFADDRMIFDRAVTLWRGRVPAYIYITSDGSGPKAPPGRSLPNWYGARFVEGVAQETCRDLGHTSYALASMGYSAETALIQGVNLYAEQSRRLKAGYEYNTHLQSGWGDSGQCGGSIQRDMHDMGEVLYNHFVNRTGASMPNTLAWLNKIRPVGQDHHMIWETVTHPNLGSVGIP